MHPPININESPEQVVDRAVDILIHVKKHFKSQKEILSALNKDRTEAPNFSENNFSLSKSITRTKEGNYIKRLGTDIAPFETRKAIAEGLIRILESIQIMFNGNFFFDKNNPKNQWGQLLPNISDKTYNQDFFKAIVYDDLCDLIQSAKKKVQILHTFIADIKQLDTTIREVLKKNRDCKFEILIMSPYSLALFLRQRGLSIKKNQTINVESKCKENFRFFTALAKEFPNNIIFATYDEIPGVVLYRVDDNLRVGFVWNQRFSNEGAYYWAIFDSSNIFHIDLENHFKIMLDQYSVKETFDHSFQVHFLRNGEVKTMDLELNSSRFSARLTKMPHGLDFKGYYVEQNNSNCAFNLINVYDSSENFVGEKRVAQIQTNISRQTWNEEDRLYIGQYTILANDGILHSNTVLLIRSQDKKNLTEEREQQIKLFLEFNLENRSTEVNIPSDITSWKNLYSKNGAKGG